jgi:hypothetical protein
MNRLKLKWLYFLLVCLWSPLCVAQNLPPFSVTGVSFYQPKEELRERMGDNPDVFVHYVEQISLEMKKVFEKAASGKGASGALVIAIKPGSKARYWLALGSNHLDQSVHDQILSIAAKATPMDVRGVVAMAIHFDAWGGGTAITQAQFPYAMPVEWEQALKTSGGGRLPDAVLSVLWPD